MNYYGVKVGRRPGVYLSWEDCEAQVKGYPGARFKKFKTGEEALEFIGAGSSSKEIEKASPGDYKLKEVDNLGEEEAVAYVDGSFDIGSFTYSYGIVYFTNEGKKTYSGRDDDKDLREMRNVSGELKGAMEAMKIALEDGKKILYLHYDYAGIEKWALSSWKANKEGTKKYRDFYKEVSKELKLVFIKVPAHAGVKYNEEADKLAKEAL